MEFYSRKSRVSTTSNPSRPKRREKSCGSGAQLQVFNIAGQLIHSMSIKRSISTIDISKWNNGIYLYRLNNEEGMSFNGKVVVLKE